MPLSETVLILMLLLAVGMLVAGLFRKLPIPYTVLLVILGMSLEALTGVWEPLEPLHEFQLTPELVLFIFLPTLIFESGLNLNARQLIKDIAPVMALAVPALLFSTAVVGIGMSFNLPIPVTMALLFGALISATDPVAVIALFKELGAPQRLTVLVEGESLLNDATAIVVFHILLGLVSAGALTWGDAGHAVYQFIKVFFGGALVGIGFALVVSWLMMKLRAGTAEVIILSLVLAYASFIVAEHGLHLSGVMAVASGSVTLGVFGISRLPHETGSALSETWEFLALICNTLLFILVGLSVDFISLLSRLESILLAVLLVLAARASMIYTLVPSATRVFRLPRVTMGECHIMWWGGLKGGLAIAIVLSIPPELPGRQMLMDITLGVVLFTLLVNAPTIRPLMHKLDIDRLTDDEEAELKRAVTVAREQADGLLGRFFETGLLSRAGHHQVKEHAHDALHVGPSEVAEEHQLRRARRDTLRMELETLEGLYKASALPQYTFMELKGELQRKREHVSGGIKEEQHVSQYRKMNPFLRLEDALVRRLREQDWAAGLLSRYQNTRTSQHLIKDIAHILMAEAALNYLKEDPELVPEHRQMLEEIYRRRLALLRDSVADVRRDYPEFYQRFESRLALRAALTQAMRHLEQESYQGGIGAKPFTVMARQIELALEEVPPISEPVPDIKPRDMISLVPLLAGMPSDSLDQIANKARSVNFLAGDTIIGEGEHGDALYMVVRGRLAVSQHTEDGGEQALVERGPGDFFGEIALLGGQVRTATVRALQPCTLLRLSRKDVLAIAEQHPQVATSLEEAKQARA